MAKRRIFWGLAAGLGLLAGLAAVSLVPAADRESKLAAAAAKAERILIGFPEKKGVARGATLDVPAGEPFFIEIDRAIRGTGRKSRQALIINGGDAKQHPRFVAGQPYLFLLKKDSEGKRWVSLEDSEIPIKEGKVQYLVAGKVAEQLPVDEFEDLLAKDAPPEDEKLPTRDSLTGNWIVVLSDKGADAHLWLVELTHDEKEGPAARFVSSSNLLQSSTLKSSSIEGDAIHLLFDADGVPVDFQGRFENGTIRGNALTGPNTIAPARMVPTEAKNLRQYENAVPDPAREELFEAVEKAEESLAPLSRFVRRHPRSPLAIPAYLDLIGQARTAAYDRAKFEKLAAEYLQAARWWGPRMELRAYLEMGLALSRHEYLPELALEYLNRADQGFDDGIPAQWKRLVGIERGKQLIAAGKESEGVSVLTGIREKYPFEPDVVYALARQAEKENRSDDVLELYGEIATLPLMETALIDSLKIAGRKPPRDEYPGRIVSRLWTEKHGDRKGLAEWLDSLYESKIRSIAADKRAPRQNDEGTRVAVCELFTNGDCEPCVGADVALSALEAAYARSEVIVLRYHQHKPGPDPLANEDSLERFKQYQASATPTVLVNGRRFAVGGGPLADAPAMYRHLRSYIDPMLEEKIDLRLQLSARADQGKLAVSAKAAGLSEFPANARLMLVLAEEKIACRMKNGIRFHEMVVRSLPTNLGGVAPVKGQLSYTGEIDLVKLRKRLAQHLAATEKENFIDFDEKPLDLTSLQLVALLQNAETGEILQAAAVPVTGSTSGPAATKAARQPEAARKPDAGEN
ncbi:MAG: hypothetical protein ACM3U2_14820 [Deltaproteobacteria bacterium]